MTTTDKTTTKIDRLLDAIDYIKADQPEQARPLLRGLIQEDKDFEDAWLWLSVAVESLDQSILCLDNVLRINPNNIQAAGALHRLRESELRMEKKRARIRWRRDLSMLSIFVLVCVFFVMIFVMVSVRNTA